MIAQNQTTFIKSRRIYTYAIGLAQEFTQSFNCKSTSRRACVTIDFSKAFDTLRWDAIETAMELLGIDGNFREMVMSCVSTASISALVEGSPTDIIKQGRGLRQGDPLSPLLFVIVIDYLLKLMKQATSNRRIELYTSGRVMVESHLAFADDIVFFFRASRKSIVHLREVLDEFSSFSGLRINHEKSFAIFSKRVTDRVELAAILRFQVKELSVKYLGTPLTGKSISYKDCDALLAELRALLTRWTGKKLSYKGRTQLLDWVFQGKFGYLVQRNVIPQAALDAIQSITYKFIWGTQKEVAWRSIIRAKSQG